MLRRELASAAERRFVNVEVVVRLAPPPSQAPEQLRDFVGPVLGAHGDLIDWVLQRREVLVDASGRGRSAAVAYLAWRSTFVWARTLGHNTQLERFRDFVTTSGAEWGPFNLLSRLEFPGSVVAPENARRLEHEIEQARLFLVASSRSGFGIYSPGQVGHLCTGTTFDAAGHPEASLIMTRDDRSAKWVPGQGLVVESRGTGAEGSGGAGETVVAFGFDAPSASFRIERADGTSRLADQATARLLAQIAPGAAQARVHEIPLSTVWAEVIVGLKEGSALAAAQGRRLELVAR